MKATKEEKLKKKEKAKNAMKEFECMLTPEQKKLPRSQQNKIIMDLISKKRKDRNEAIQDLHKTDSEETKYESEVKHSVKKETLPDGSTRILETDFN